MQLNTYCGALMTTPDYMLAGVNTGHDAPLIDLAPVCDPPRRDQPPEPCGWLSVCEAAIGTPGAEYLCDPQNPPDIFPVDPPEDVYYPLPNDPPPDPPPPEPNPGGPNGG